MERSTNEFNQRFNELRKLNKFTDCSFNINNKIINSHKLILTAASPVFEAMFYGEFKETMCIKIIDIREHIFEMMLDYIYTGKTSSSNNNLFDYLELYYCGQKYLIDNLKKYCYNYLYHNIRYENLLPVLNEACNMNIDEIFYTCLYLLRDCLKSGRNFGNYLLDNITNLSLSKRTFYMIVSELIDFDDDAERVSDDNDATVNGETVVSDNIICFIYAWCLIQCNDMNLNIHEIENIRPIFCDLNLSEKFLIQVLNKKLVISNLMNDKHLFKHYPRFHYKTLKPLVINFNEMEHNTILTTKKFIVIRSLYYNSRLIPSSERIDTNRTYVEDFHIEISCNDNVIYNKHHTLYKIEYISNIELILDDKLVLFPNCYYNIKFKWDSNCIGYEYPRNLFSPYIKKNDNIISFNDITYLDMPASILNGIKYHIAI